MKNSNCVLVGLFLLSVAVWSARGADSLRASATYADKLARDEQSSCTVVSNASASLRLDCGTFTHWLDSDYPVVVSVDGHDVFNETLDSAAATNSSGCTFYWTNAIGTLTLLWNTNRVTLSLTSSTDLFGAALLRTNTDSRPQKSIDLHIQLLEDVDIQRTVKLQGSRSVHTVTSQSASGPQKLQLYSVALAGKGEMTGPAVTITYPGKNLVITNDDSLTVTGTAKDVNGISDVCCCVSRSPSDVKYFYSLQEYCEVDPATGQWSYSFDPESGTNYIWIQAYDSLGNRSPIISRTFFKKRLSAITLDVVGDGTISGITNGQILEVGCNYTITAKPGPGKVLRNWIEPEENYDETPSTCKTPTSITFTMCEDKEISIEFVDNPFTNLQGTYTGLFYERNTAELSPFDTGAVDIIVNSSGSYSAKVRLASGSYSASGKLRFLPLWLHERPCATLTAGPTDSPLYIHLYFLNSETLYGFAARTPNADMSAFVQKAPLEGQLVRSATNPIPVLYHIGFDSDSQDLPLYAFGEATVAGSGQAALKLTLPDRSPLVTIGSKVNTGARIPFFAPLYGKKGFIIGWLSLQDDYYRFTKFNLIGNNIRWFKPATSSKGTTITNALSVSLFAGGCPFVANTAPTNILSWSQGLLGFENQEDQNSAAVLSYDARENIFSFESDANIRKSSLKLDLSTGRFSGNYLSTDGLTTRKVQGVWFPSMQAGYGFYSGTNGIGGVCVQHFTNDHAFDWFDGVDESEGNSGGGGGGGIIITGGLK